MTICTCTTGQTCEVHAGGIIACECSHSMYEQCPWCKVAGLEARDSANKAMAVSQNNAITELYAQLKLSAGVIEAAREVVEDRRRMNGILRQEESDPKWLAISKALASFDTPQQKEGEE